MWRGLRRPWWMAFAVTWLVVILALTTGGTDVTTAARIAFVVAAIVAVAIWGVARAWRRAPP